MHDRGLAQAWEIPSSLYCECGVLWNPNVQGYCVIISSADGTIEAPACMSRSHVVHWPSEQGTVDAGYEASSGRRPLASLV